MRIEELKLIDGSSIELADFTVVIGGNGVGKSTLLREIFHNVTERPLQRYRWLDDVVTSDPNPMSSARSLLDSLALQIEEGQPDIRRYRSRGLKGYEGTVVDDTVLEKEAYERLLRFADGTEDGQLTSDVMLRRPFFASHTCDHRLNVPDRVPISSVSAPPTDALNVLWRYPELMANVADAVRARFGVEFVLLEHSGSHLELGIADEVSQDAPGGQFDRQEWFSTVEQWKHDHWVPITEAGHGIRAMVNLLLSVFEPVNRVLIIDEPELFLYPTQKRELGGLLVRLAQDEGKQIVLVTHDASFLQGVLDATTDAAILRVSFTQNREARQIKSCTLGPPEGLPATWRQREYLNALFHEHVVLVEGASDRALYQGVADHFEIGVGDDIGFVVLGGKGGSINTGSLCKSVDIPFATVFDFDVLLGSERAIAKRLFEMQGGTWCDEWDELCTRMVQEAQAKVSEEDPKAKLRSALKQLKQHGVTTAGLKWRTRRALARMIEQLMKQGVFVLKRGELESWMPTVEARARFAEEALAAVAEKPDEGKRVRGFVADIYKHLVES